MNRLKMQGNTVNTSHLDFIKHHFPACVTEVKNASGALVEAIDFEKLRVELGDDVANLCDERYQFTWPGKSKSLRLANSPTTQTLRPCRAESEQFESTRNLYIEGDNLEVLKLMRKSYSGKVNVIYIDPPYNTGNIFIYDDDFSMERTEFLKRSGQIDEEGNRLVKNTKDNGRFHTDWLNMMYPRLKLARDLLSDDGLMFISIDDSEIDNLSMMCKDIFGEQNFIAKLIWKKKQGGGNDSGHIVIEHEYVLVIAKNSEVLELHLDMLHAPDPDDLPYEDEYGHYSLITLDKSSIRKSDSLIFDITGPDGTIYRPRIVKGVQSCWRWGKEKVASDYDKLVFKNGKVYTKNYGSEGKKQRSLLIEADYGRTNHGGKDLLKLFGMKPFSYPKPVSLIRHLITLTAADALVLDFFSGSATTAQAVMEANALDGGSRSYIMVQIDAQIASDTSDKQKLKEMLDAGYHTICSIAKQRIRLAAKAVLNGELSNLPKGKTFKDSKDKDSNQEPTPIDAGFRVLKLDSSNMADTFYHPEELSLINLVEDNIKPDRSSEDLLFQSLLETDLPLSAHIATELIHGKELFVIEHGFLIACFDRNIDLATVKDIAMRHPQYFFIRDRSLQSDDVADNLAQLFTAYSPATIIKVL